MSKRSSSFSKKLDRVINKRRQKQMRELITIWIGVCDGTKSGETLANLLNEICHCTPSQSQNGLQRLSSCDEIPHEISYVNQCTMMEHGLMTHDEITNGTNHITFLSNISTESKLGFYFGNVSVRCHTNGSRHGSTNDDSTNDDISSDYYKNDDIKNDDITNNHSISSTMQFSSRNPHTNNDIENDCKKDCVVTQDIPSCYSSFISTNPRICPCNIDFMDFKAAYECRIQKPDAKTALKRFEIYQGIQAINTLQEWIKMNRYE